MTLIGKHSLGSIEADTAKLAKRIAYDVSNNPIYVGTARPGTATSAASWSIQKITYDGSNNATAIQWADGNSEPDNIWDNRASLTYS